MLWSALSLIALLGGPGIVLFVVGRYDFLGWQRRRRGSSRATTAVPPARGGASDAGTAGTAWYFLVVAGCSWLRACWAAPTAHYHVEPSGFYGISIADWLPYNLTRTWHVQLALFFVSASFLAMGIFIAPMISGTEPRRQDKLAIALFAAAGAGGGGQPGSAKPPASRAISDGPWFWIGDQGWEYLDLGRLWQILLVIGHGASGW